MQQARRPGDHVGDPASTVSRSEAAAAAAMVTTSVPHPASILSDCHREAASPGQRYGPQRQTAYARLAKRHQPTGAGEQSPTITQSRKRLPSDASGDTMATKTITTYEHTCDLCGKTTDKAELRSVCKAESPSANGHLQYMNVKAAADVCAACQDKPISDLIAALDADAERRHQPSFAAARITRPA
jgi:hypothetical protein